MSYIQKASHMFSPNLYIISVETEVRVRVKSGSCMQGYKGQAVAKQRGEIAIACVSTLLGNNAFSVSQLRHAHVLTGLW